MRRLTGADAVFLYSETPTTPTHTLKISIFKPQHWPDLEEIKQHLARTVHRIPSLRWRILPIPFAIHHPVAVDDPEFDMDFHIRHVALPGNGSQQDFEEMIGQISSHMLDRHRPLWELWIVRGLQGGRVAFVMKIHHALADGLASVQLFTRLITDNFEPEPQAWNPAPLPTGGQLFWRAILSHARYDAKRFPDMVRTLRARQKALKQHREDMEERAAVDALSPEAARSRFNGALTTQRQFAIASLPLASFKAVKNGLDGTINDVVMAVVAGALRNYLLECGDPVDQPLTAVIPVTADAPGTERLFGNNFGQMGSSLNIGIEDPVERFKKIQLSTRAGKSELEVLGRDTIPKLLNYLPPFMFTWVKQREYRKQSARHQDYRVFGNVSVSNVPGPRETLMSDGSDLESLYSVGPLLEGCGLNITVWSYVDQLNFSILSCKKLVPDPQRITGRLQEELALLAEAAGVSLTESSGGSF